MIGRNKTVQSTSVLMVWVPFTQAGLLGAGIEGERGQNRDLGVERGARGSLVRVPRGKVQKQAFATSPVASRFPFALHSSLCHPGHPQARALLPEPSPPRASWKATVLLALLQCHALRVHFLTLYKYSTKVLLLFNTVPVSQSRNWSETTGLLPQWSG